MPYALHYSEELSPGAEKELREFTEYLRAIWYREHNEDGTHNFGAPLTNGGESTKHFPPIDLGSQSFINQLNPGFVQMMTVALTGGVVSVTVPLQALIDAGDLTVNDYIRVRSVDISEAELEVLATTGKTIVLAPGAGKRNVLLAFAVTVRVTTAYSGNPNFITRYVGIADNLTDAITSGLNGISVRRGIGARANYEISGGTGDITNRAIEVKLDSNPGSVGIGVATVKATAWYRVDETNG